MGRRKKPCEYCSEEIYGDYQEHPNGFMMWYEWYPFNGVLSVIAQACTEGGDVMEDAIDFNFEYCPYCGRKLTEV